MTAIPPYSRNFSFTNFQTANPATPLPGNKVDLELNAIKGTTDATITNLSLIQRSDGALANASVGVPQLMPGVLTGISPPTQWSDAGVSYGVNDTVFSGLLFYVCNTANVSSADAPPSGNANWTLLADFSVVSIPPGSITSAAFAAGAVDSAALGADLALLASPTDGDDSTAIATTAFVTNAVASIPGVVPYGVPLPFAGSAAPTGWLLCAGQAVSRTDNPNTFTALGTTYGTGDGSTTFNLPNYAGAAMVGVGGTESITLNESLGAATVALTTANLAAHSHTDTGHSHTVSDGGHVHSINDPGHVHSYNTEGTGGASRAAGLGWGPLANATGPATTGISLNVAATGVTVATSTANLSNTGSGTAFSIYQPSIGVNFIIRAG